MTFKKKTIKPAAADLEALPATDLGLPPGWFSADDVKIYQKLANSLPDKSTIVEIGVWQGRSLCSIARQITEKDLRVYAVDTFEGTPGVQVVHDCEGRMQEIFQRNAEKFGFSKQLTILRGHSPSMANDFQEKISLVFIDGDHKSESVAADIEAWWPHVRKGGLISGHDFSNVADTIEKILGRVNNEKEIWWLEKK